MKTIANIIRLMLGIPPKPDGLLRPDEYEIRSFLVNPEVVRMDMKSFRNSKVVREQATAAKNIIPECKIN